jgi:hypothetical protein
MTLSRALSLGLLLLSACGARVEPSATETDAGATETGSKATPPPSSTGSPPSAGSDGGSGPGPSVVVADGTLAASCNNGVASARAMGFNSFVFIREKDGCGGAGACTNVIKLDAACTLVIRRANTSAETPIVLGPSDCNAMKNWLTSELLWSALRNPSLCGGVLEKGNPEMNDITTNTESVGVKTPNECMAAPLPQHRACLQKLLDLYKPGETLN